MNEDLPPPEGRDESDIEFSEGDIIDAYEASALKAVQKAAFLLGLLRRISTILEPTAQLAMNAAAHAPGCLAVPEDGDVVAPDKCICTLRPILQAYRESTQVSQSPTATNVLMSEE